MTVDVRTGDERERAGEALAVACFPAGSEGHLQVERSLLRAGTCLPMGHRAAVVHRHGDEGLFVAVRDSRQWIGGLLIRQRKVRALPGYSLWHVDQLGDALPPRARDTALRHLLSLVREHRRVLRCNVSLFSRDANTRTHIGGILERLGFGRAEANTYTRTVAVDLRGSEDEILGSFSNSVRKRLREFSRVKIPVRIEQITDPSFGPRMNELMRQTMARTGGRVTPVDWPRRIALANTHPELCRIVGVVHGDLAGEERLLAFVCGSHHGTHAQYAEGASARDLGRVPLMYPLLWDLMRWARDHGAEWFDMGGVTASSFGDAQDRLGGISDFKRRFADHVVDVGEEWIFEPPSVIARVARHLNRLSHRVHDFRWFATAPDAAPSRFAPAADHG